MFRSTRFWTAAVAVSALSATPVFSDAQTTEILEEYFELFKSAPVTIDVGTKDDGSRFTQWNDIVVKYESSDAVLNIPWIKVSRKLLGGLEMTFAEEINGALKGFNEDTAEPIKFVVISKGAVVGIDGEAGARSYASEFDEVTFKTVGSDDISIDAIVTDGTSTQTIKKGEIDVSSGDFSVASMTFNYAFDVEGKALGSAASFDKLTGTFEIPLYKDIDQEDFMSSFDANQNMLIEYNVASGLAKTVVKDINGTFNVVTKHGVGFGKFALLDSIAEMSGETQDVSYDITAPDIGLPPIELGMKEMVAKFVVPLDNTEDAKASEIKFAMTGLNMSEGVWSIFDPKAILPRDEADLDIDLSANMLWLKKLAEINVNDKHQAPPVALESAKINAINLRVAGAELQTDGAIVLDNSQFPPVPDGTVNVSLKGAQGLLTKLSEAGLLPLQNALAIRGMSAVFFEDQGDDHLVSTIKMNKNGRITANDVPIK
ncbi:DUF2125 domain-containing protein [Amylibacter sp. SFDW26]|uniref:DUF2125 domain-containing protein n=1 Tax=Amylibacter sp. SFDW26 TaxID=2652722 RepID=UPI001261FC71|nr:DUF2125 domain-containing protein [Amylibacter sp. SFDW26]KAB7614465.1 DUF2125 domain-containing protein [Amylibacter sp. SFDW26]